MSSEQWCDQSQPHQPTASDLCSNTYNNNAAGGNSSDSDLQSPTTQLRLPQQPQHTSSNNNNEKDSLEASFPHHHQETSSTTTPVPNFLDNPSLTNSHQYPTNFYPSQSYSGGGVSSEGGHQMRVDDNTEDTPHHHEGVQGMKSRKLDFFCKNLKYLFIFRRTM